MMRVLCCSLLIATSAIVIVTSCSRQAVREELPPQDQFALAMKNYDKGDYLKSQAEFQRLIFNYPGQTFIDTAQYYLASSFYGAGNYPEAIGEYRKFMQAYPSSGLADKAQFGLAMCYYKESPKFQLDQTDTYSAIDEFSIFFDKYPMSPLADEARQRLNELYDKLARKMFKSGELYLKLHDYNAALIYFGQVRDNYPNSRWAMDAFYDSGVAELGLGKKDDALKTFEDFVTAFPDGKLVTKAQKRIAKLKAEESGG